MLNAIGVRPLAAEHGGGALWSRKKTKDVGIAIRDDVQIVLRIYRPERNGPFPTLFAASPYRYDNNRLPAQPVFRWWG